MKSITVAQDLRVELQQMMTSHIDKLFSKLEDRLLQAQFEDRSSTDSGVVKTIIAEDPSPSTGAVTSALAVADLTVSSAPAVPDEANSACSSKTPLLALPDSAAAAPHRVANVIPQVGSTTPAAQVQAWPAGELPQTWEIIHSGREAREVSVPAKPGVDKQLSIKAPEGYRAVSTLEDPNRAAQLAQHFAKHKQLLEDLAVDIRSFKLNVATLVFLALGAGIDGIVVDSGDRLPMWLEVLRLLSCVIFALEMCCRIYIKGFPGFWDVSKKFWQWHWFQTIVVLAQECEWVVGSGHLWLGLTVRASIEWRQTFRILASLRILRTLHVVDNLDCGGEFHLLMASLCGSVKCLGWSAFFVIVPMFVFAMTLTQGVGDVLMNSLDEDADGYEPLHYYFGSLERSMVTLFVSIAGGLSWEGALYALKDHDFMWLARSYILYIVVVMFAVLNVVTGVFVASAMASSDPEKKKAALVSLRLFFDAADSDGSGTLDEPEFKTMVNESKDLKAILQELGIAHDQAFELFDLMDHDGSGELESDEFVEGVTKFQGPVNAIDFASFRNEFVTHVNKVEAHIKRMEQPACSHAE